MIPSHTLGHELPSMPQKSLHLVECGLLLVISAKQHSVVDTLPPRSTPGQTLTPEPETMTPKRKNPYAPVVGWLREDVTASIPVSTSVAHLLSSEHPTLLEEVTQDLILL